MSKHRSRVVRLVLAGVLLNLISYISGSQPAIAAQVQQPECQIGLSSSCPALNAQEVYNLYGYTVDTPIWISSDGTTSGTGTQVFALMYHGNSTNSGWILMAKGTKGTSSFGYSSSPFTSNSYTLNTSSLSNDVTTDAVFSAYDSYPISSELVAFSNPTYGSTTNGGDIASNYWGAWVWKENYSATSMYSLLTTTNAITGGAFSASTPYNPRLSLYMNGSNNYFSYQSGYAQYGFSISPCKSARWGIVWNNEASYASCDDSVGLGLSDGNPGDIPSWNGVTPANGQNTSNGANGGLGAMAFQLWGRDADPAFGTPQNLTVTSPTAGQASLSWSAPASGTVSEYVVQYKKSTDASDWSTSHTFRVTAPSGSPTALVTGLTQGAAYNFRVWARASNDSSASPVTGNLTVANGVLSNVSLNTTTPIYRTTDALTATVSAVGYATFYAQGKAIPGCKNIPTTSSSVTCNWIPAQIAYINLSVSYAPSALPSAITTSSLRVLVAARASGSHKR